MACYSPLRGYRARATNPSGRRAVVFNSKEGFHDLPVNLPCGQCTGCRLERSRQWAIRCMHEASQYNDNCFITLTYDDDNLPANNSLDKTAFPKFMRRLRKKFKHQRIRYYHAGEYGDQFGRPHYHACIFNLDFPDKTPWSLRGDQQVYRSALLEKLWPYGNSEIGSVTFESAAYVARYIMKKVLGDETAKTLRYEHTNTTTGEITRQQPEYATMSRRPGIGKNWFDKYRCEVYAADSVIMRGKEMKPPRYYDGLYELQEPELMDTIKQARQRTRQHLNELHTESHRRITEAKLKLNPRRLG